MAVQDPLVNNAGTYTLNKQNNVITLATDDTYVTSDIEITTKVKKAILDGTTDQTQFTIQIPNGNANDILLVFTTDTDGNTVVTGGNVTT